MLAWRDATSAVMDDSWNFKLPCRITPLAETELKRLRCDKAIIFTQWPRGPPPPQPPPSPPSLPSLLSSTPFAPSP